MSADCAIEADGLRMQFGDVVALDGLDLDIRAGTVSGLLGPNGAGKTTLVRILATLLAPTAGRARVLGHDVTTQALAVRRRIALAGQFAAVDGELTGREIRVTVVDPSASAEAFRRLDARRVPIAAVEVRQPSLDDVFLTLTGRPVENELTHGPRLEAA